MTHYVGLDVSMEETAVCVIDGMGELVWERKVSTDPGAIADCLAPWRGDLCRVGLEAGGLSPWLYHGLVDLGIPAVCICRAMVRRVSAPAGASPAQMRTCPRL